MNNKTRKKLERIRKKQAKTEIVNALLRDIAGDLQKVKKI